MKIYIDGSNGTYRLDCECSFNASGRSEREGPYGYSPAIAIAEATVHHRMCHNDQRFNLQFSERFKHWLEMYWIGYDAHAPSRTVRISGL